jgi:nucleotide-binding universal stress UspA family protein
MATGCQAGFSLGAWTGYGTGRRRSAARHVVLLRPCTLRKRRFATLVAGDVMGDPAMFQRILLPVDGSEHALNAVNTGIELAVRLQARVFALHVLPPLSAVSYVSELIQSKGCYSDVARERAQRYLGEVSSRASAAGVPCEGEYVFDLRPYVAIVAAAAKHQCDLIVMASRGTQGFERMLLGSETHKVMLSCDVPVLVCH